MSIQEKRHTSSKTTTLHLRYLASFMDEIDREVVSLTDRAFKSLCIGDEAIYNDSEFSPCHVSCHKPRVEEVSKTESLFSAVKKLDSYPLNGVNNALGRSNKNSLKDTSHFAMLTHPANKSNEGTKMTNGDSWDKSALLSIQRELSEFSSDYHSLSMEQLSPVKNNFYSDEKGSAKKSSKDSLIPSGKSPKCKHNKNNKLKKLNYINFFLHSEFSPFLSWRDLNTFSIGQDHISEIMMSNRQSEWYDSPLYKELTAAHEHYKSQAHPSEEKEAEKCPIQTETQQVKVQPKSIQSTSHSVAPKPKKEVECVQHDIITKAPMLANEQRCNLEKVEPYAPWRTNKSRARSANPVGHSFITLPERTKAGEWGAIEKEVKTIEDKTSTSSTPFSISQLLTPVIPSRHGTGTSEILQAVLSPSALEVPLLTERDMHPSPEIKREGYKSIASSLLFNLKDNRKRVKAMYSPPKFKGLDVAGQSKESPQPEMSGSKDALGIPEISGAKTISPARQKATISPMSPLLETEDPHNCSPQGFTNERMPDDFLALGLLQSTGSANRPLKSHRSPLTNKVAYPSLQMYRKATPEETLFRANSQTVVDTSSQVFKDKASNPEHIKDQDTQGKLFKELQGKTSNINTERIPENNSVKSLYASSTTSDEQITSAPEQISNGTDQNKLKTKETVSTQKSPVKEKESNKKEEGSKHLFSARQHNYIKSQRFVNSEDDDDDHDNGSNADKVLLSINDTTCNDELSWHPKNTKTKEIRQEEHNTGFHQDKVVGSQLLNESVDVKEETTTAKTQSSILSEAQEVKNEAIFMKGNTSAKRAVFASKEQVPNKTTLPQKKVNTTVMDKYDLAKLALEEVIAEREQRKLKSNVVSSAEGLLIDRIKLDCEKPQCGNKLPNNREDQQISMFMPSKTKDGEGQNNVSALKTIRQTNNVQIMSEDVGRKHGESHVSEKLGIEKKGSTYKPEIPQRRGRSDFENNAELVDKPIRNKELRKEDDTSVKAEKRESREVSKARRSQSKNRGPVRGNVSALKEKYDKESGVQKCQSAEGTNLKKSKERPNEQPPQGKMKQPTIPKLTVSPPEIETYSIIHKDIDSGNKTTCDSPSKASEKAWDECGSQRKHNDTQDFQKTIKDLTNNRQEMKDCKVNGTENKEESSVKLKSGESHSKSKGPCKSHVKEFLNGLFGLSSTEKGKAVDEHGEELTEVALNPFEFIKADQSRKDSITIHDILGQAHSLSSLNSKQTSDSCQSSNTNEFLQESEHGTLLEHLSNEANSKGKGNRECTEDFSKSKMDSYPCSNHDRVVSPPDNVEKKGWVHCLIESARNLTQISQNHISSKDLLETAQPLLQRESLNRSENGEEDLNLFKECTAVTMPAIPDKSPQSNQQAMHFLSPLSPQHTAVKEEKLSVGSFSVSEEEEQRSAVSTLSEEMDSYEASRGDTFEENISSTALTDAEGSKAPSERSGSVCSGVDGHGQNKPPAVPPKTEKALRRAMKLNTRRIQKAEAKSKSEHKGRSSDKSVCHKPERRHHSTDKIQTDKSEQRSLSSDRHRSDHLNETPEARTQRSEKHSRSHSNHKSQNVEESDHCKQSQRSKSQDRQTNKDVDSKSHSIEKRQHQKSNHIDHLENRIGNNDTDRLSRTNEKSGPRKLERRTQSLDRFLRKNPESKSINVEKSGPLSVEKMHCSTSKALPLQQNSNEHTYPPASNVVTQSFPITQRKLLQDPDSGQYFLVDMPVQVKTKTFFDPETKSYVQLPVQSPEGAVRQAPSLEVINTPPLVLYHGFVPVPVSSVPSQKSIIRTSGSIFTPDDLDDFETGKKQMQGDFYQKKEMHSYIEPVYVSQEDTAEDEIDSVR
ncbi:uncharacterized protein [Paramisgurnus dabryanus]|uniref:uncharacterized protein n=1 Tax=Paramisgurnus dabryanus TaxID=90735 RepID=UPI0031F3B02E